jgi:hypothetical protein
MDAFSRSVELMFAECSGSFNHVLAVGEIGRELSLPLANFDAIDVVALRGRAFLCGFAPGGTVLARDSSAPFRASSGGSRVADRG